jgi:hypothetical protein
VARNGSGGVTNPAGGFYPPVAGTLIESAKVAISWADVLSMLATSIASDGQTVTTQRIPFAAGIQTDTVTEKTVDTGVTLDSVLLKDGRIDTTQGADIVCSATINLETATGNVVDVTGSTGPVTAVTLSQGHWRLVRFTSTPTLTHSATLVLPTAASYTCTAGDYILFVGYAASTVRAYILPTSGPIPFVDSQPVIVGSADKTKKVRFEVDGLTTATTRVLTVQDSDDTLVGRATTDTLTNKTLTTPTLNGALAGTSIATQAQQETATATDLIVSPGRQHFHPTAAKVWCSGDFAAGVFASHNVSSLTDGGTGIVTVNFSTALSSTNYAAIVSPQSNSGTSISRVTTKAVGSVRVDFHNLASALVDVDAFNVVVFGDI